MPRPRFLIVWILENGCNDLKDTHLFIDGCATRGKHATNQEETPCKSQYSTLSATAGRRDLVSSRRGFTRGVIQA
jgi:hypothetical protein